MPILEGIYLEATPDGVKLKCSDLMLQKECILPATVEEEGSTVIPGKLFSEIVRKLPESIAGNHPQWKIFGYKLRKSQEAVFNVLKQRKSFRI